MFALVVIPRILRYCYRVGGKFTSVSRPVAIARRSETTASMYAAGWVPIGTLLPESVVRRLETRYAPLYADADDVPWVKVCVYLRARSTDLRASELLIDLIRVQSNKKLQMAVLVAAKMSKDLSGPMLLAVDAALRRLSPKGP